MSWTYFRRDFNHCESDGQELCIFAEGNRYTEHEQSHGSAHHDEDLNANSFQQTVSMMRRTTEQITDVLRGNTAVLVGIEQFGTLKTVESAHNTTDTKCSVSHVAKIAVISKGRCESIRNGSFFREKKQSYISVNKTDCDTADTKQENSMRSHRTR